MEDWKQLSRIANKQFSIEAFSSALDLYQKALSHALSVFSAQVDDDPDGLIASVLVSHFNIADTYGALNKYDLACQQFETAFNFLQEIAKKEDALSPIQTAIMKACSHLNFEWASCINQHGKQLNEARTIYYLNNKQAIEVMRKSPELVH